MLTVIGIAKYLIKQPIAIAIYIGKVLQRSRRGSLTGS